MNREQVSLVAAMSIAFALAACVGHRSPDSAPNSGAASAPALPGDAIPKHEPLSRYGNGPYYEVYGITYEVMESSHGFQERGVASWYGTKFHGRPTSSQETYDMYAMTAAHKTLPLPTYVRVRNLKNGRSIVVRVNDRGPFVDNRIIDLSYSAARKLDMIQAGTSLVEVTALNVDAPSSRQGDIDRVSVDETGAEIFVQVGAFSDRDNAKRRFDMLRERGVGKVVVHKDEFASPVLYRIRVGPIADVDQYDTVVQRLNRMGIAETHLVTD